MSYPCLRGAHGAAGRRADRPHAAPHGARDRRARRRVARPPRARRHLHARRHAGAPAGDAAGRDRAASRCRSARSTSRSTATTWACAEARRARIRSRSSRPRRSTSRSTARTVVIVDDVLYTGPHRARRDRGGVRLRAPGARPARGARATAGTASCRSAPTSSARTCRPRAPSACACTCGEDDAADEVVLETGATMTAVLSEPRRRARRRHPAPALQRGSRPAARSSACSSCAAGFEAVAEREVKKLPTLRGRTVAERLLRGLDAHVVVVRARGQAALGRHDLAQVQRLVGGEGRDAQGHAADARRLRARRRRHPPRRRSGAAALATRYTRAAVVNAGDGAHQHPTQSLLDLYTMRAALGRVEGVHVAIVGDVLHSRVARSNIALLLACGAHVTLVGPPVADPARHRGDRRLASRHDIADIAAADVVYVLRMQRERMLPGEAYVPSLREYTLRYGRHVASACAPGQVVMHPGPMNRGVEITDEVADSAGSLVTRQVRAGLVVRMAVLYDLLAGPEARGVSGREPGRLTQAPGRPRRPARARRARARSRPRAWTRGSTCSCATARSPHSATASRRRRAPRWSRLPAAPLAARVHRPARASAHARPGAQGGPRDRHGGGGRGRLLHGARDAQHRPRRRLAAGARLAARARRDGCARARRIPGARSRWGSSASRWRRSASSPTTAPAGTRTTAGRCSRPRSCGARCSTRRRPGACSRCTARTPRSRARPTCTREPCARASASSATRPSRSRP